MRILKAALLIGIVAGLFWFSSEIHAAKPRVRKSTSTAVKKAAGLSYSSAKLSRPTNSVILTMKNLDKATKVSYILSYSANGIEQGAAGSITPGGSTETRDLYFGTCSKGVCTPHTNIKNATLTVTTYPKASGKHVKRYRIKI